MSAGFRQPAPEFRAMPVDFDEARTLAEARNKLRDSLRDGSRCSCCGQHAQIYRRKLNRTMVRCLAALHAAGGSVGYVHAPTALREFGVVNAGGDVGKLALWGLAAAEARRRDDGGHAGHWRLTTNGYLFLVGEHRVERFALVYDGRLLGREGELVGVRDVVPEFRLDELLEGR